MKCRMAGLLPALTALALANIPALAHPVFTPIARSGGEFPDRPGFVYDATSTPFIGGRSADPRGDIFFQARAKSTTDGSTVEDLLVFRRSTGAVEPYARTGESLGGAPLRLVWGAVGGGQSGVISHIGNLQDGSPTEKRAVLVSRPDGSRFVAAAQGQAVPGYSPTATFDSVGFASGAFSDVNMNRTGIVSYGGSFRDAGNTVRFGYYLTQPGGSPERIVDSTMPVPNRPSAQWVAYDGIAAPFDIYTPGLDEAGNAYFRGKYRDAGQDYRAFYRRGTDGALSIIADTDASSAVPGMSGYTFRRFPTAANNQRGDAAFGAQISAPDGTLFGNGVFVARAGQSLAKVLARGDSVPGIPEAQNHTPALISMNESGHLLLTVNYSRNGQNGQSLLLYDEAGAAEVVLRFDETPGFPDQRALQASAADLNSLGDAVFITRMSGGAEIYAAFAYLNDTNTLVPVLKTGDALDGRTVVSFGLGGGADDPLGSVGASGGPVSWTDSRDFSLSVVLRDEAGNRSYALYTVHVPEPATGLLLTLAALGVLHVWRR